MFEVLANNRRPNGSNSLLFIVGTCLTLKPEVLSCNLPRKEEVPDVLKSLRGHWLVVEFQGALVLNVDAWLFKFILFQLYTSKIQSGNTDSISIC